MKKATRSRAVTDSGKLTPQMEEFCRQYILHLNATKAAIAAGYSAASATQIASRHLVNPAVQEFIQRLMNERSKRTEITADAVLQKIWEIADVDLAEAYSESGSLLPIHEIPESIRRAIAGVKVFDEFEGSGQDRMKIGETVEVKFNDKIKALELLGRHLKLFTDKVEHSGTVDLAARLAAARKRMESV